MRTKVGNQRVFRSAEPFVNSENRSEGKQMRKTYESKIESRRSSNEKTKRFRFSSYRFDKYLMKICT